MRPGFWQILIITGLLVVFFLHPLLRILRALTSSSSHGGSGRRRRMAASRPSACGELVCPHCRSANPEGAKFCNSCGKPIDFIDV